MCIYVVFTVYGFSHTHRPALVFLTNCRRTEIGGRNRGKYLAFIIQHSLVHCDCGVFCTLFGNV